jgi:2-iminobutanoate/2-iminopropanoate deaminase
VSNPQIRRIQAENLPRPVGPYSPGTVFDRLVFVSGQSGRDPVTGLTAQGVEEQTEQTLRNIETILKAAGTDLQHVLRCGVFLMDMAEFAKMNAVYERLFAGHKPARTTVQVAGLPGDNLRVEIDCVAVIPG